VKANWLCRAYALLLYAYPRDFRRRFGGEMKQVFRDRLQALDRSRLPRFIFETLSDWLVTSTRERIPSMLKSLAVLASTVLVYLVVSTTLMQAYVVPTPSMEGSLRVGDHLLVNKFAPTRDVHRGDLVAFRYPEDVRQTFIKRVIGLPGDHIRLLDKQVIRNGRRLVEPYAMHSTSVIDAYRDNFPAGPALVNSPRGLDMLAHHLAGGEVTVPARSLFVLGDNRDNSLDSRYWGFVPSENIVGRPLMVYWSYDAPTQDLATWNLHHFVDLAGHFFTKTRWDRTLLVLGSDAPREVEP
jgi:signal peptidase I